MKKSEVWKTENEKLHEQIKKLQIEKKNITLSKNKEIDTEQKKRKSKSKIYKELVKGLEKQITNFEKTSSGDKTLMSEYLNRINTQDK